MKKLTKDKITVELWDGEIIAGVNTLVCMLAIFLGFILCDVDKHTNKKSPGYYCEYCDRGICFSDDYYSTSEKAVLKQKTIAYLQSTPCPDSKDGMHKIKWYRRKPEKITDTLYIR